ncbi:MAG: tryptophan--tRNA ligase [bacterium]|nr:tryptophan--tRNA ligase [bacterium]
MKPILISGIQPSGKLHIGNYLGALKNFVDLQNTGRYQCYFFIADLHALTENPEAKDLSVNIINLAMDFLAAGLDPKKSIIFQQSKIQSLQELKWILSTLTPVSELMRMTAFKEKVLQPLKLSDRKKITKEKLDEIIGKSNFGLAEYPVLMAADILIYKTEFVPVGEDQLQHLEFARMLVRKFNGKFGETFIEPKPLLTEVPRLMSLDNPNKKMSKSLPAGCLFLDDSPEIIRGKIKKAVTDSGREIKYDSKNKPAISNLMKIYQAMAGQSIKSIEKKYKDKSYGDFKKDLTEVIVAYLSPFQKTKKRLKAQPQKIMKILETGAAKARIVAQVTMEEVKKKIGLI